MTNLIGNHLTSSDGRESLKSRPLKLINIKFDLWYKSYTITYCELWFDLMSTSFKMSDRIKTLIACLQIE